MLLSELCLNKGKLIRDGNFDILAQCVVVTKKKILTFFEDLNYYDIIVNNPSINCIICMPNQVELFRNKTMGIMVSNQPRQLFFEIHNDLVKHGKMILDNVETSFGKNCNIHSVANISRKNVLIGDNVVIEEYVSIRDHVTIGDNTIIRAGSILGGQGYEFKRNNKESILTVEHAGKLIIKDNVEIKEMCTIHRAVFNWDNTTIGDFCKIDAHTHIGHATKIGNRVMIGSHANITGNVIVEDDVYVGPGVTVSNRLHIGNGAKINIGSVVSQDVESLASVTGNFAIEHKKFIEDLKNKSS